MKPILPILAVAAAALAVAVPLGLARWQPEKETMVKISDKPPTPADVKYSKSGFDVTPLSPQAIDALAAKRNLTDEQKRIILNKGTEMAFCGDLVDNHKEGLYACKLCGLPLFASDAKFDSGTGWPSFFKPVDKDHVRYLSDTTHGMTRTEIQCARCTAHLGHVFEDGPRPTGLRFCLNSASLDFFEKGKELPAISRPLTTETAYFAGGCFWGVEDRFQQVPGVIDAVSGYMGGKTKNPTYEQVCTHTTGHAETVKVVYDPQRLKYRDLLQFFFMFHDPTQVDRQGPDVGDNYRSAIFASTPAQADEARKFIAEKQAAPKFKSRRIATQVIAPDPSIPFYPAEDYHQDYHMKHGGHCPIPTDTGE